MSALTLRRVQAAILLSIAAFLGYTWLSGRLYLYINQRFMWLTVLATLILLAVGIARLLPTHDHDHHHGHNHAHDGWQPWPLLFVALPVILGLLAPANPLSARAIDTLGISFTAPVRSVAGGESISLSTPSTEYTILDWVRSFNYSSDPTEFIGQSVDLVGFVYHDKRLPDDLFMVGRFTITCCVADAFALGIAVDSNQAGRFTDNMWIHLTGTIDIITIDGQQLPLIRAEDIKEVSAPPQPYLFP